MISASAIIGVVLGALAGGKFIQYGRRRSMIIFNIISAVALVGCQFLNLGSICAGRLVFGFCSGVLQVAGVKMLEETVPK
jgi:MFS family permease